MVMLKQLEHWGRIRRMGQDTANLEQHHVKFQNKKANRKRTMLRSTITLSCTPSGAERTSTVHLRQPHGECMYPGPQVSGGSLGACPGQLNSEGRSWPAGQQAGAWRRLVHSLPHYHEGSRGVQEEVRPARAINHSLVKEPQSALYLA